MTFFFNLFIGPFTKSKGVRRSSAQIQQKRPSRALHGAYKIN